MEQTAPQTSRQRFDPGGFDPGGFDPGGFDAALFDLDGVITDTAVVHATAWKRLFDPFLRSRAEERGEPFDPFTMEGDYLRYVDGMPRYQGVRSFLESRGIELPYGDPDDAPGLDTVCALGNLKNRHLHDALEDQGVEVFAGSVRLVERLKGEGLKVAVVSSSKNTPKILEAAGLSRLFDLSFDGNDAARFALPGKPDPHTFLKAAELLGVAARRAVVVEDAVAGVEAGRSGGFGLVIGVDRRGEAESLRAAGADLVVSDLGELA